MRRVLGVVQGLTEFLPVSSTAHLLIAERLLGFDDPGGVFTVMIQLGSILAIMWLYRAQDPRSVLAGSAVRAAARGASRSRVLVGVPAGAPGWGAARGLRQGRAVRELWR